MPRKSEPSLSNHVRNFRLAMSGMTQQALAEQVGVTRQTIIAMEGGAYTPSLALAMRIAKTFDKTVEDVFSLDD